MSRQPVAVILQGSADEFDEPGVRVVEQRSDPEVVLGVEGGKGVPGLQAPVETEAEGHGPTPQFGNVRGHATGEHPTRDLRWLYSK